MNQLQLKKSTGLPVYFINEIIKKTGKRKINYANTELMNLGDQLLIGDDIFQIAEILEQRDCALDYGQPTDKQLMFQSTICDVIFLAAKK